MSGTWIQAVNGINVPRLLFLQPPSIVTHHHNDYDIGHSRSKKKQNIIGKDRKHRGAKSTYSMTVRERRQKQGKKRDIILQIVLSIMMEFTILLNFAYSNLFKYTRALSAAAEIILKSVGSIQSKIMHRTEIQELTIP